MEPSAEIAIIPFHFKQKEKDDASLRVLSAE
jgi:hypothetical protein